MLSVKWSRVVVGAIAGAALVGAAGYRRKVSAMPNWKERAREEAFKASYNLAPSNINPDQLFKLSFEYPPEQPNENLWDLPFMKVDFREEPEKYLNAVLDYCFEGNTECDFRVQDNKVRQWYNAPWMASRPSGREPIHGLTMERPADPGYLSTSEKRWLQTWAIGFYNSFGGYTIGKFWDDPGKPALTKNVLFPEGTVSFKLLFTEGTPDDIPVLEGAKVWQAAIGMPETPIPPTATRKEAEKILAETTEAKNRGPNTYPLRLIQVDIMVRDPRSKIGWVFGTFMYDKVQTYDKAAHPGEGEGAWRRLVPMALQWGNDPELDPVMYHDHGKRPEESWTSPRVKELKLLPKGRPYLGYLERANGIVDNFISSCASCHSAASVPLPKQPPQKPADLVPDTMKWFRNIKAGEPFEPGVVSLDYSLQLWAGVSGFKGWLRDNPEPYKSQLALALLLPKN
ncbi:uncharacterized protein LOC144919670 [Branchiostoma floridae x Branchiostoma belcheri]